MSDIIARLDQQAVFRGRRCFAIQKSGKVTASYRGPGVCQEYTLELAGINPNATSEKHVARDMIVGLCIFLIPTLGFLYAAITARFGSEAFFWFIGSVLVCLLPVGLCWREYVRRSYDLLIFGEPMTGNRLVIFRSVPDQAAVDGFVSALRAEIQKARVNIQDSNGPNNPMLSTELEKLAALRDRGVLTDAEFQRAKTTLLEAGSGGRSIGFQA